MADSGNSIVTERLDRIVFQSNNPVSLLNPRWAENVNYKGHPTCKDVAMPDGRNNPASRSRPIRLRDGLREEGHGAANQHCCCSRYLPSVQSNHALSRVRSRKEERSSDRSSHWRERTSLCRTKISRSKRTPLPPISHFPLLRLPSARNQSRVSRSVRPMAQCPTATEPGQLPHLGYVKITPA